MRFLLAFYCISLSLCYYYMNISLDVCLLPIWETAIKSNSLKQFESYTDLASHSSRIRWLFINNFMWIELRLWQFLTCNLQFSVCCNHIFGMDFGICLPAAISFGSECRWGSSLLRLCPKNPRENAQLSDGGKLPNFQLKFMFQRKAVTKENSLLIGRNFACLFGALCMDLSSLGLISHHKSCSRLNVEHSYLVMWHFRVLWCGTAGSEPESGIGGVSVPPILLSAHVAFRPPRLLWLIMLCFGHLIATWFWMWLLLWLMSNLW